MDRTFWRREAAMLRREGQHMFDVADEIEREAIDPARHAPAIPAQPASLRMLWFVWSVLLGSLAGLVAIGMRLLG